LYGNFFSYLALPRLTQHKPTVFTLHDMWTMTGHCAFNLGCERWRRGCGRCPHLDTMPAVRRDATHVEWLLKQWTYSRSQLVVVAPSAWMATLARDSIMGRFPVHHIPNGVDTDVYTPLDPVECRVLLGISPEKTVLMFSAHDLRDRRKGGDLLLQAVSLLPRTVASRLVLLLVGNAPHGLPVRDIQVVPVGHVMQDRFKAICYSAADLFVFPTRWDNMPLTLLESLACGTPVVSFKVGGVPEIVRPGVTGALAEPENVEDLAAQVLALIENEALRERMRKKCRAVALAEYRLEQQVERCITLYRNVVAQRRHA
jgi:glycosyltransferase involved in cell wall biosynthesis